MRMRVGLLAALLFLAFGLEAQPGATLDPSSRVFGVSGIGGPAIDATYLDAVRHFGEPGSTDFHVGWCGLHYPRLGLSLWYDGALLDRGTPQNCRYFAEAVATGAGWHTRNGLSIGDTTSRLRQLYPHVYDTHHSGPKTAPHGSIEWDITITCCGGGERPALSAMVAHGRVVALRVDMVGH